MGLSAMEMDAIVKKVAQANPRNCSFGATWKCAIRSIRPVKKVISIHKNIEFNCNGEVMAIKLPSPIVLSKSYLTLNKWGAIHPV
jgi:hypothetical protein